MRLSAVLCALLFMLPAVAQNYQAPPSQGNIGKQIVECKPSDLPATREDVGRLNLLLMETTLRSDGLRASMSGRTDNTFDALKQIGLLYEAAGKDKFQARAILARALDDYYVTKESCKSVPQVQQVSLEAITKMQILQCTQNQRIIELLEYIAAKKP